MNRTPFVSIRWKLLATMLLIGVVLWGTLAVLHGRDLRRLMHAHLEQTLALHKSRLIERGRILAQELRREAEKEINSPSLSDLSETLDETSRAHGELIYVILLDATGKVLFHSARPELARERLTGEDDLIAAAQRTPVAREMGTGAGTLVEFIEPIRHGGAHWGALRLGLSLSSLAGEALAAEAAMVTQHRTLLAHDAVVWILFSLIGALAISVVIQRFTKPLTRLTDTARQFTHGDFSAARDLPCNARNEVGLLSQALSTMAANLASSHAELEGMVQNAHRAEMFLESIVENLPNMVFVKDARDLRFVLFNRAGEKLLGYRRDHFIGKSDHDLFAPAMADAFNAKDREVLTERRLLDIPEEPIVTRDGATRYLHTRKIPLQDENGEPRFLLGISEDITELKLAIEERRLFFTRSLDLLCIADFNGHYLQINPAFETVLGYSTEDLLARPYIDFVHPDDVEATLAVARQLTEGVELVSFENRYFAKDGTLRWLHWSAATDTVNRRVYAAARDMTERRKLEEEIVHLTGREQERMAHELHDGLGQILTGLAYKAKFMERSIAEQHLPTPDQARQIVALSNQASEQVRALARGLDPIILHEGLPLALQDLAHSTREMFGIASDFRTDCPLACVFRADCPAVTLDKFAAIHLYRIAQEAVNNAVRHARARHIVITLHHHAPDLQLSVADDGCGVPAGIGPASGTGLRSMHYRAKMIRGTLTLGRGEAGGTIVTCSLHTSHFRNAARSPASAAPAKATLDSNASDGERSAVA